MFLFSQIHAPYNKSNNTKYIDFLKKLTVKGNCLAALLAYRWYCV